MHGSFERATPAQAQAAFDELNTALPGDFTVYADAADVLAGEASRAKLVALRQRSMDARSVFLPLSDEAREVRVERQKLQARLAQLKLRRGEGGPELDDSDLQVRDAQQKLSRVESEIERLSQLAEHREALLHARNMLAQRCEDFSRTAGGKLIEVADIDVADVLRKNDRPREALDRLQYRGREILSERAPNFFGLLPGSALQATCERNDCNALRPWRALCGGAYRAQRRDWLADDDSAAAVGRGDRAGRARHRQRDGRGAQLPSAAGVVAAGCSERRHLQADRSTE
jgi:hypothetical protein